MPVRAAVRAPGAAGSPRNLRSFLLRPGSIDRSTSLWWLLPVGVVWATVGLTLIFLNGADRSELSNLLALRLLAAGSALTFAWGAFVVATQDERDTDTGHATIDPAGRHGFWKARTVAWDVTALGAAGLGLFLLLLNGPDRILPERDVPLVELSVLMVTLALLASFSRYAAMAFSTDSRNVAQTLEEVATLEEEARQSERERLRSLLGGEIDRLLEKSDEQLVVMQGGLERLAASVEGLAAAVARRPEGAEAARLSVAEAAAAQRAALEALRARSAARAAEAAKAAAARRQRIAPQLEVTLRVEGVLFHAVWIDVRNAGWDARALELEVTSPSLGAIRFTEAGLPSSSRKTYRLCDVAELAREELLGVQLGVADADGERRSLGAGPFRYTRSVGLFGTTRRVAFEPAGWIAAREPG